MTTTIDSLDCTGARKMMARATTYAATMDDVDTEYMLAVHGLSRLAQTSILTARERDILSMRYKQDKSNKEIAAALGVAQSSVCKSLMRARARIREVYAAIFPRFAEGACAPGKIRQLTVDRLSTGARA